MAVSERCRINKVEYSGIFERDSGDLEEARESIREEFVEEGVEWS